MKSAMNTVDNEPDGGMHPRSGGTERHPEARLLEESVLGTVINADSYRELSNCFSSGRIPPNLIPEIEQEVPEYAAVAHDPEQTRRLVRTHLTSATTNPASSASKDRILRCIRTEYGPGASPFILVLNGGSGSGKTRFIANNPESMAMGTIAFDSTLTAFDFAEQLIAEARAHGRPMAFNFGSSPESVALF